MVPRPRLFALNPRYRRPQHRWTQEERLLLCSARRFFDLSYKDIAKIFNHIYATKIRAEGFFEGLPAKTLNTQYEDLKKRDHKDWRAVHYDVNFDQGPSLFHHIIEKIRHASQVLHIGLVARARDLVRSPQGRPIIPQSRTSQQSSVIPRQDGILRAPADNPILHSPVIDQDRLETSEASTQPSQTPQVPKSISKRIRSFKLNSNTEKPIRPSQIPNLLWRFANDESQGINHRCGFVAKEFLDDIFNIPPIEERTKEFGEWVRQHVTRKKMSSALISTSVDPLVVIHRAVTQNKYAFFSLIDSSQIDSQHIFHMQDMIRQFDVWTPGYRGTKEYVVYGCICRSAIVTSIRTDELLKIAETHPDIRAALQLEIIASSPNCKDQLYEKLKEKIFESDFAVGATIGKLLRLCRLPLEYVDDVAALLNKSWSFTSSDDTAEFSRGASQGFQTNTELSIIDQVPEAMRHSQGTYSESQDESIVNGQHVAHNVDAQDYVMVDPVQREEAPTDRQAAELRHSMDGISIHDDGEDFLDDQIGTVNRSPSAMATTTATRVISVFEPDSESWVMVPETQRLTTPGVVESVENALPASGQGDDDDGETGVKTEMEMELPALSWTPHAQPIGSQEYAVQQTPTTPTRKHNRSYSESSESTISAQTAVANHRLSEERSRVNRVLNYDWPTFWDSLHQVGTQ